MILSILDFLPFLRSCLWLQGFTGGAAIEWNSAQKRFQVRNLKCFSAIVSMALCGIQYLLVSIRMGHVLFEAEAMMHHITSLFIYIGTTTAYGMGLVGFKRAGEIVACFNSLIQIEEKRAAVEADKTVKTDRSDVRQVTRGVSTRKNLSFITSYWWNLNKMLLSDLKQAEPGRLIIISSSCCQIAFPLLILFFLLEAPCSSQVFIRSTLSDCGKKHGFEFLPSGYLAPLVVILDVYYIFCTWSQGCIGIGSVWYLTALCIRDLIKRIKISADDLPDVDKVLSNVRAYKEVQLLERQFNNINRGGNLILIMTDMTFLGVTSLYSIIALHDIISIPILALSIIMAVETVVLAQMFMYGAASDLHTFSDGVKESWKFNRAIGRNKYLKRLTKSCTVMKTLVGRSGNFLDKTTPLVASQMTVDQTASLLLMTEKKD